MKQVVTNHLYPFPLSYGALGVGGLGINNCNNENVICWPYVKSSVDVQGQGLTSLW